MEKHSGLYLKSWKEEKISKIIGSSKIIMNDQRSDQRIVTQKSEERIELKC